jgi:hypothetical protein
LINEQKVKKNESEPQTDVVYNKAFVAYGRGLCYGAAHRGGCTVSKEERGF